jgi:hypothetical protein
MSQLGLTPPNLPLAPDEYERRYQDQLNNVLRLFFSQVATPGASGGTTLYLDLAYLPTDADIATLRPGDVFRDTTTGATANSQVLRIKTAT